MPSVQPLSRESSPQDFQTLDLAFLGSLLPGIIHNWATPLSGVIGATQLLEKRATLIEDLLKDVEQLSAAERDELQKQLDRNRTNVEILSRNAQHLADLLQILVYRITRGSGVSRDFFPLNELVQNELRFLEANLHFKHKVRKQITLAAVVPATAFSYGFVATAIDELITYTIARHNHAQGVLEMDFVTGSENDSAMIRIEARICAADSGKSRSGSLDLHLTRLKDDGWAVDLVEQGNSLCLTLQRPQKQSMP
jgi:signal transduction histidine kinase